MRGLLFFCSLIASAALAWKPPAEPDPQAILTEARADRMAGRFAEALAKHEWFHAEALKIRPSLYGVRASYAVNDWSSLAHRYPPAMASLRRHREEAARAALAAGEDQRRINGFHDAVAVDRALHEPQPARELFRVFADRYPALAPRVYRSVQEMIIEAGDYATAQRYLDPERDIREALLLREDMGRAKTTFPGAEQMYDRMLGIAAARVVALLVLANRPDEARKADARVRAAHRGEEVTKLLDRALEGQVPAPMFGPAERATLRQLP